MKTSRDFADSLTKTIPADRITFQKSITTVHPESSAEAAETFKLANQSDQKLYITGFGNHIDPIGQKFENLVVIRTDRLGSIQKIDPENLTIEVGAGFPLGEINEKLKDSGVFFPLSNLPYPGSVGGALAVGLSATLDPEFWKDKLLADGSQTPADINIKRYLLEAEIALPDGTVKRVGSANSPSATGDTYCGIFTPSWGLLGLMVSAKLRLMPESGKIEYSNLRQQEFKRPEFVEQVTSESDYLFQIRNKIDAQAVLTDAPLRT